MGGPEMYKNFDTASVITGTTEDTVNIGKMKFRKRELFLGGIAIIALIGVLVLAIALAVEVGKMSSGSPDPSNAGIVSCGSQSCLTTQCMKVGAYTKENMEESAQPCNDFYTYACGGYAAANPRTPVLDDVSPVSKVAMNNEISMVSSMFHPVQRNSTSSYERKLKYFFNACTNHFDKMELGGQPFVNHVISKTHGWDLFGEFEVGTFDLQKTFNLVHTTFWTGAFFGIKVNPSANDWNKNTIYLSTHNLQYSHTDMGSDYHNYIRHMATLMAHDKNRGAPVNPHNTLRFASDVFEVESMFADNLTLTPFMDAHLPRTSELTLNQVNRDLNNTLDVVDFLKNVFNEWPDKINGETKLQVSKENDFKKIGTVLNHYMSSDQGKRKIHNYLMWQLLHRYSHELSWNYVHTKRTLLHHMLGLKETSDGSYECFLSMESAMPYALSALYVKHYVNPDVKKEGTRLMDSIKLQILTGIDKFDWMSKADRYTAKQKIRQSLYKVGYPDEMFDNDAIDRLYITADITDDHFQNVLSLNKLHQKQLNDYFGKYDSRHTQWRYHIFYPIVEYYNNWHEMLATAAVFQSPLFSSKGPAYFNFGGVGSVLAQHLIHAVDRSGNRVKMDRSGRGSWWSNTTTAKYAAVQKCVQDAQNGTDYNYLKKADGTHYRFPNALFHQLYAPELLSESTGIRLSLKAYMDENGQELLPPVLNQQSASKLFFLAYAQTHCQNTDDSTKALRLNFKVNLPSREKVNLAVSQVPEFAEAFNCPASAPLANKKKCLLFP